MNVPRFVLSLLLVTVAASPALAAVTQTTYQINAGGQYQYKPSPFVPIPGGSPSASELDFGVSGTFVYELDTSAQTVRLLNLNLVLTGNEAIQAAPPLVSPVTADRVEAYLASHLFVEDFVGGGLHLESSTRPNLKLTDWLNGDLSLIGGYDATPIDGDAIRFQFTAVAIPEPAAATLAVAAAAFVFGRRRR